MLVGLTPSRRANCGYADPAMAAAFAMLRPSGKAVSRTDAKRLVALAVPPA
jgi:hypothetical protein